MCRVAASTRGRVLAAVLAAGTPALVACGSGFDAQTNQIYQPADGVNDHSSEVAVVNAVLVADDEGNGTLVASLINEDTEEDSLVGVEAATSTGLPLTATIAEGEVPLPPSEPVQLADNASVSVAETAAASPAEGEETTLSGVEPGAFVSITLQFERAAVVELSVPVVGQDSEHSDVYEDIEVVPPASTPTETQPTE
jgi:hypothetical protein